MNIKTRRAGCLFSLIKLMLLTIVIAGVILYFSISFIVPPVVHYTGKLLGIDMSLDSFSFSLVDQSMELENFYINNPEGFSDDSKAINLDRAKVSLSLGVSTFLDDLIVIDEITVEGYEMFLEYASGVALITNNSNINALLDKVKSEERKEEAEGAANQAKQARETGTTSNKDYKVIIKKISFKNGKLAGAMYSKQINIALPDFEITDIGVAEGGVSFLSAGLTILTSVSYQAMTSAVKGTGSATKAGGKSVGGVLESGFETVKSIFDGF